MKHSQGWKKSRNDFYKGVKAWHDSPLSRSFLNPRNLLAIVTSEDYETINSTHLKPKTTTVVIFIEANIIGSKCKYCSE